MTEGAAWAAWLRQKMQERGLTQKELAGLIGVEQQQVSRYLTKGEIPGAERVYALAAALGVTVYEVAEAAALSDLPLVTPEDVDVRRARLRQIRDEADRQLREMG